MIIMASISGCVELRSVSMLNCWSAVQNPQTHETRKQEFLNNGSHSVELVFNLAIYYRPGTVLQTFETYLFQVVCESLKQLFFLKEKIMSVSLFAAAETTNSTTWSCRCRKKFGRTPKKSSERFLLVEYDSPTVQSNLDGRRSNPLYRISSQRYKACEFSDIVQLLFEWSGQWVIQFYIYSSIKLLIGLFWFGIIS